jgi:hypothetical protein
MTTFLRPLAVLLALAPGFLRAADPLPARIDAMIDARAKGNAFSPPADDAEFLRRVTLDLAGRIPSASEARAFLDDRSADKRTGRIDALLAGADYPRRMQELFNAMLMERLGERAAWNDYLRESFRANRPWDAMARDILRGMPEPAGASFFLSKRLENYGENPVDYANLTRDIGRLFLGKDLRCAQCHDHLFIKDYKQADFQGLFGFVRSAYLADAAKGIVGEKPGQGKMKFISVFGKLEQTTGPRLPGRKELTIPVSKKGDEYRQPPDPKKRTPGVLRFSPLEELAREVPQSPDFSRNIVNRLWWAMMGRGLVHPLDLHHAGNPASHPELLDLLAREFVEHEYDIQWLLRQLALTKTYQRSSRMPEGVTKVDPALFLTAVEKRLSAEQLLWATLEATGMRESITKVSMKGKGKGAVHPLEQARLGFVRAFAGPRREPEEEFAPSLRGALFLLNEPAVLAWFAPQPGNLVERLGKVADDKLAEELYLSVLTRRPDADEAALVAATLKGKADKDRTRAVGRLAWALVASTEFAVNH